MPAIKSPRREDEQNISTDPITKLKREELTLKRLGINPKLAEFEDDDPGRKAPNRLLHALIRRGLSNIQISWMVEDLYGETYTRAAVSYFRKVNGYEMKHPTEAALNLIPWTVTVQHNQDPWNLFLYYEARERSGTELDSRSRYARDAAQRKLAAASREAGRIMVITYDRKEGFSLVPARDGIDTDLIRDPRWDDDGRPNVNFKPRWGADVRQNE